MKKSLLVLFFFCYSFLNSQTTTYQWGIENVDRSICLEKDNAGNIYNCTIGTGGLTQGLGLAKYNANGTSLWNFQINAPGAANFYAIEMKVEPGTGDIYVVTYSSSGYTVDMDPSAGVFNLSTQGQILAKYNSSGVFQWAFNIGTNALSNKYTAIALDAQGNVYLAGTFYFTIDFDPSVAGTYNLSASNPEDLFLAKYSSNGDFLAAKSITDGTSLGGLEVDYSGNIFIMGSCVNQDIDMGAGVVNYNGAFLEKMDANFNYISHVAIPSPGTQTFYETAMDGNGNFFIGGSYSNAIYFSTFSLNTFSASYSNTFIVKYNNNLVCNYLIDGFPFASSQNSHLGDLTTDALGNIYAISSKTCSSPYYRVIKANPSGTITYNLELYSSTVNDCAEMFLEGIALDNTGSSFYLSTYKAGSVDYDPGAGVTTFTSPFGRLIKYGYCTTAPTLTSAISGITAICNNGAPVTYSIADAVGSTSYNWSLPSGWSGSSSSSSITTTPGSSGGNLSVTASNSCGTSPAQSLSVTVNSLPTVLALSANDTICNGDTTNLICGGSSTTFTWNTGDTDVFPLVHPSNTTSYSVIGTDANGCQNSDTITITVNQLPTVLALTSNDTICNGDTTNLICGGGATSFVWNTGDINVFPNVHPSSTAVYSVVGTDFYGCSNTDTVQIVVNQLPIIIATASNDTICSGQSTHLIYNGNASNFVWSTGDINTSPGISPSTSNQYSVIGTDLNGCQNSDTIQIVVNQLPNITITTSDSVICSGNSVTLTAIGATSYLWSTGTNSAIEIVTPTSNTIYSVTGIDANGCANSAIITQLVDPCIGLEPQAVDNFFINIYPNPANDVINVSAEGGDWEGSVIQITNCLGQVICTNAIKSNNAQISLKNLSEDMYLLNIINREGRIIINKIYKVE